MPLLITLLAAIICDGILGPSMDARKIQIMVVVATVVLAVL